MYFNVIDNKTFEVRINSSFKIDFNDLSKSIKNILYKLNKKYNYLIRGYYEVNIYRVKELITLLLFKKIDNDNYLNTIDLKIINHNKELDIIIDDFLLNKQNIYNICEHYSIRYDNLHS